jgi:predicted short-subunit dehydrogenase-like oxidoreductase (DUF2520 family)
VPINSIIIIGSGNVATAMGIAFAQLGLHIQGVYSPTNEHVAKLASRLHTNCYKAINELPKDADLYLLAVKDEAIEMVSRQLVVDGLVVHVSGSTPLMALSSQKRYGVFYALQTFTKSNQPDFTNIPFLVEANNEPDAALLLALAGKLSTQVSMASTQQRQALHVAAVFANNFTNYLAVLAKQLLEQHHLPYELLKPLLLQTATNATQNNPELVQTGPAIRGDERTIHIHEQLLKDYPEWLTIYQLFTKSIQALNQQKKSVNSRFTNKHK